jgi:hypothetical protein
MESGGSETVNQSTNPSESSPDGFRPPSPPRLHVVEMGAGDAIASIAVSLITFILRPKTFDEFVEWFQEFSLHPVTKHEIAEDLTDVRETLKDMGYSWP